MSETLPPLVKTIKEKCRVCYTCVRNCPAKAIKIRNGQAEVIAERCIGCGNCVRLCSQQAKVVWSRFVEIAELLKSDAETVAIVAPSFPVEFTDCESEVLVGMLRTLGFSHVNQVAFGADLVAKAYRELLSKQDDSFHVSTTCPSIVAYVQKYMPDLVPHLAPIVSPMIATARVVRELYGPQVKVIFIGPCVAKKEEARHDGNQEVDYAITFAELRRLFIKASITPANSTPSDFDPPKSADGRLFPVKRGLLHAAGIEEDLARGDVIAADGQSDFIEILSELDKGVLEGRFFDILCCRQGCIMGPGFSHQMALYKRRQVMSVYARKEMETFDQAQWEAAMERFEHIDLKAQFRAEHIDLNEVDVAIVSKILQKMGKQYPEDELNCGACGYDTCFEHAAAVASGFAESEMCLPYMIGQLSKTINELEDSHTELASTQEALVHSEKLASMGQLAAGIAHEVNNPLGVVIMYANLLLDCDLPDTTTREDLKTIVDSAMRCKKIVSGLLRFARQNKLAKRSISIKSFVKSAVKSVPMPANIKVKTQIKTTSAEVEIDADQMLQVFTNLLSNSRDAITDKGQVKIKVWDDEQNLFFEVEDSGNGIAREHFGKVFNPFFTTKQIGEGTGLGLAVSYGIVKMHSGDIKVESNADPVAGPTWTRFTISVPLRDTMFA